jgi:putative ABC transport system substrate-binding protein
MTSSSYPVERGLIASLARPGGNITGLATHTGELMAKRVQILKEAIPGTVRLAVLRLPGHINDLMIKDIEAASTQLGLRLQVVEVRRAEDLPRAFQAAAGGGAQAIMTTQGPFFALNHVQIADLARRHRLPSLTGEPGAAEAGTLMFYGPHIREGCQRAASYVDRILKGAKPGDLPVEQPTKIELVINSKTATALGITIPPSLQARADQVIQ